MGLKFNPFSGNFDFTGSGGGGGSSYIDGEVNVYADLSLDAGVAPLNTAWLVRTASGAWLLARKPAGIYIRTATAGVSRDADYTYAGILPDVFNDANFLLYDNGDSTKNLAFQLSGITTGTTRTLTVPNASGTLALTSDIPTTFAASAITSGTLDNARVNFAAPAAIGGTTAAAGSFTTLTANNGTITASAPALDLAQTWNNSGVTFTGLRFNATNTASASDSRLADFQLGGSSVTSIRRDGAVRFHGSGNITALVGNGCSLATAGNGVIWYTPQAFWTESSYAIIAPAGSPAIYMERDADSVLALRNGTKAHELRVYGSYTSTTNYQRLSVKTKAVTLSALSGASVATTTGFIPDGAVLVGLTTRVSTAITGATGYDIGDGSDADRWGANVAIALNTSSDNTNWTAGTIECFTAAQEVTLTAVGSNFTGGAVVIVAHYLAGEAD